MLGFVRFGPIADKRGRGRIVRFVPEADIRTTAPLGAVLFATDFYRTICSRCEDLPVQQHFVVARTAAASVVIVRVSSVEIRAGRHRVDGVGNLAMVRSRIKARRCRDSASTDRISGSIVLGEGRRSDGRYSDDNSNQPFHGDAPYS